LVATLGSLKGAFAKAGQFASIRHDVLPTSMTAELASLRDRVPPLPYSQVRAAVEAELRAPLESLFDEFEREPLGAASIAQVHRARLTSGESVAVKVQYPWLEGSLAADLRILRALLRWWTRRASPARLDLDRIFEEFARGLREELNFEQEADVAREIAENLAEDPQIVVPAIIPSHSTKRILTMTYLPAVRIDDRDGLAAISVAPSAVLEILGRAYAMQMFRDGLFHADPHPGNLFVVDEPAAGDRPRLLFVDFGLSRRLDPELRREMRLAIHALLKRDLDGFIQGMQRTEMIVPGFESTVRRAVSSMFEELSVAGGALSADGSRVLRLKDQAKLLLQDTEGLQLPNDLLLYAKTLSYVFRLGDELAPEVDLMKLTLPYLLEYLAKREP
jgi:predicted unusual protein kinase regulating ubiquinone biosynthesis (AarF/ABC1/UbiB family)